MIFMTTPTHSAAAATEVTKGDLTTDPHSEDQTGPSRSRRQILVAAGLGAGTLTLAACGSSSTAAAVSPTSSSSAAASPAAAAPTSSAAAAPARSAVAAPPSSAAAAPASSASAAPATSSTSTSAAAASPPAAAGGKALVALSKVPVAGAVAATDANGKPIIVAQPTAGTAVAFSAICTHKGCTVEVAGAELDCLCHGSKYNALTGMVIKGPAPKALASVPVTVKDGNVVAS